MTRNSQREGWWRAAIWFVFVLLCVAAGGLRLYQAHLRRVAVAAWQARCAQLLKLDACRKERMIALFHDADCYNRLASLPAGARLPAGVDKPYVHKRRPTIQQFEALFNNGQPLVLATSPRPPRRTWTDPQTGRTWDMTIDEDQKWTGYETSGPPPGPPQPKPTPLDQMTEKMIRRFAGSFSLGIGPMIWLFLLVGYAAWRSRRGLIAEVLLGLAILCSTAWLVAPNYSLSLRGVLSNDMLFWGIVMLLISAGLVIASDGQSSTLQSAEPTCETCGYNLTGNVSGTCPECGTAIGHPTRSG